MVEFDIHKHSPIVVPGFIVDKGYKFIVKEMNEELSYQKQEKLLLKLASELPIKQRARDLFKQVVEEAEK